MILVILEFKAPFKFSFLSKILKYDHKYSVYLNAQERIP